MVASVVVSTVVAFVARKPRFDPTRKALVADVLGIGIALAGFLAWFVRPKIQTTRGLSNALTEGLQLAAGKAADPTRTYSEHSMHWMAWYLGPIAVAAGIVGAGLLVRAVARGRSLSGVALVAMLGPSSAMYLWQAKAVPDQVWVMRRYLICALPLLVLLAFGLVATLMRWVPPPRVPRAIPIAGALVIGAFAIGYPISTVVHIRAMTEQRGDLAVLKDACATVGSNDGAIVVLQSAAGVTDNLPQALRGWCDVPVANMIRAENFEAKLKRLAAQWRARRRELWVVAGDADVVHRALPGVKTEQTPVASNGFFLGRTLLERPEHYALQQFSLVLARVPPG
jgi:hypothetical protein